MQKNDSTIADVYLQLDVTDNLDTYLERERVRKLKLSEEVKIERDGTSKKKNDGEHNTEEPHSVIDIKVTTPEVKLPNKDSNTNKIQVDNSTEVANNVDDKSKIQLITTKTTDVEIRSDKTHSVKIEENETDRKDRNRFLWVTNVNKSTKATDLKMHLAAFGSIQLAKIVTDGKECFGYVVMESHEDVVNCMKNLQNSMFEGKQIVLSDKIPEKKRNEKSVEGAKDKEARKAEKRKNRSKSSESKDTRSIKSENKRTPPSDPLTLRVLDSKQKGYSEERRRVEELERKRFVRDRLSAERREFERKRREMEREREREKERQREREREREMRRRENERQKLIEMKLEKERKKLEYERKMIEREKMELLRYKRKLFKEKENESVHDEHKRRHSPDKYDRKKFNKIDDHSPKHSSVDIAKEYWKNDNIKSTHDLYKKSKQEVCIPSPPILSNNYHAAPEAPRSTERDRQWYDRKEFDNRAKSFGRKPEDNRNYNTANERPLYQERSFPKEQYKHKEYSAIQQHNSWSGGYSDATYKEQNIPVLRSEIPRTIHQPRHQTYQEGSYVVPSQDYYAASGYRRVNEYYNRPSDRKY